jgi:hypothetical protein
VRRTVPDYTPLPLNQVLAQLRGCKSLHYRRFPPDEACKIAVKSRRESLCVLEVVVKAPRYLPTNEVTGTVLLIEDEALANDVLAMVLHYGIPMRQVEF